MLPALNNYTFITQQQPVLNIRNTKQTTVNVQLKYFTGQHSTCQMMLLCGKFSHVRFWNNPRPFLPEHSALTQWGANVCLNKAQILNPSDISTLQWQGLFMCLLCPYKPVTWHRTAKDLHSHTDVAAVKPRARVDSNVSGDHWHWEDVPDWDLLFPVATEDLLRQKHSTRW